LFETAVVVLASSVWSWTAAAVTSTLSATEPTFKTAFTRAFAPAVMVMPLVTEALNPSRSTRMLYSPTGREGIVKSPLDVETVADVEFVAT
jgi:hypothetical protein